jgi:hypothetical protein
MVSPVIVEKPGKPKPFMLIKSPDTAAVSATETVAPGIAWVAVAVLPDVEADEEANRVLDDGIDEVVGTVMVVVKAPTLSGVADPTVVEA